MIYYRRYVGDYLRDTPRLTLLEHGAYTLLLDYYYADEKPLPLDKGEIYVMVRAMTPADRKAVDKVLATYFKQHEDGYHNARADKEIATSKQARENGKGGGRPKTGSETGHETGSGTGSQTGEETGTITGNGGGSSHPPTTNHQPPAAKPSATSHQPPISAAAKRRAASEERAAKTRPTRQAYSAAYERRWEVEPTWDKQANSMMAQFVDKVGVDDAPAIASFYLSHNRQDYVRSKHDVSLLLRDARGLRTEWQTGRRVTDSEARQTDKTAGTLDQVNRLLNEREVH